MGNLQFDFGNRRPSGKAGELFATIFLILFATPFAGFGLVALIQGVKKLIAGDAQNGLMLCLFGLVFSGVGFGLMFGAVRARKKSKQTAELQANCADKPWLARPDWAAGRIKWAGGKTAGFIWLFAIFWNAISTILTVTIVPEELHKGHREALFALIFPLIGLGLLVLAIYTTLVWRRFKNCAFEMAAVPAALGGTFEGMIQTGTRLRPEHGLRLRLVCLRRETTGSGKSRHANESILWEDEKILGPDLPEPGPGQTGIPVHFKLPADQPESTVGTGDGIYWRLEATAKISGPDFRVSFDVPVFKLPDTGTERIAPADPTAQYQMPIETARQEEHSRIRLSDGPNGREFFFPAARNPGAALFMTFFMLFWSAAIWFMIWKKVPLLFPIVFGLFDVFIVWGCFSLWFKSSRVTIDPTTVTLTNRWLFFNRTRAFPTSKVTGFQLKIGMTSGSQAYHDIKLVTPAGSESFEARKARYQQTGQMPPVRFRVYDPGGVTVASGIASTVEANWLVQEMTKALGRRG
jgi:hypothetical protein